MGGGAGPRHPTVQSDLNAVTGSTRAARRAGSKQAPVATIPTSSDTTAWVSGSKGSIPKRPLLMRRVAAIAAGMPATTPLRTGEGLFARLRSRPYRRSRQAPCGPQSRAGDRPPDTRAHCIYPWPPGRRRRLRRGPGRPWSPFWLETDRARISSIVAIADSRASGARSRRTPRTAAVTEPAFPEVRSASLMLEAAL